MTTPDTLMTAEELLALPDDRQHHELVRGVLITTALPGEEHGYLVANIGCLLGEHVRSSKLGRAHLRLGCKLESNPDSVRAPDVAFVKQERLTGPPQPGYRLGAPDLVVEVVSPNDRYSEVDEKVATWLAHGTAMVLVVNPRWRTVLVHRPGQPPRLLTGDDVLDGDDVVPGWRLPVRDIFSN